ncbi:S-layer homology domain-containing protein [Thermanaeromonas toyohensis ToBE]|uniref:S-layer homology domain-containing protein n=1 Tax=Thermanaeromonas toyohensis ToBE TaxID=698762 RepID=A0A1W1VTY7_9FIRM|nr:S-layer homology domain-containing protein [Thermanaeromonas toyohensis]SMB96700.1 S-layer homology domain-containing protein [Thermanaeromonas toyohensis ToBE]
MKKTAVLILTGAILALILPLPAYAQMEYLFVDKDTIDQDFSWGKNDIIDAIDYELYSGYPDGTLRLNNNITRAEFAAILSRVIDVVGTPGPNWYDAVVDGLVKAGIIPDKSGNWDAAITRLEAAKWLGRLARIYSLPVTDPEIVFRDTQDVDALYAGKTGLIKGIEDGVLGIDQNLNRAQAIVLLNRINKAINIDLASDEDLTNAAREAIEDLNKIVTSFDAHQDDIKISYKDLPYRRVTPSHFELRRRMFLDLDLPNRFGFLHTVSRRFPCSIKGVTIAQKHRNTAVAYVSVDLNVGLEEKYITSDEDRKMLLRSSPIWHIIHKMLNQGYLTVYLRKMEGNWKATVIYFYKVPLNS